jgi:Aminomethyltransferase folate-binding domain
MALWNTKYWMGGASSLCKVRQTSDFESGCVESTKKTGPAAADHLQALTSYDLRALTFGRSAFVPLEGLNVHVARCGYTGEDGFEVSFDPFVLYHVPRACGSNLQPWASTH